MNNFESNIGKIRELYINELGEETLIKEIDKSIDNLNKGNIERISLIFFIIGLIIIGITNANLNEMYLKLYFLGEILYVIGIQLGLKNNIIGLIGFLLLAELIMNGLVLTNVTNSIYYSDYFYQSNHNNINIMITFSFIILFIAGVLTILYNKKEKFKSKKYLPPIMYALYLISILLIQILPTIFNIPF